MIRKKILMAAIPLFVISGADAAVSLDRTRAVFDGSEKSMTLDISNDNKQLPYLAQAWIENENQEKIITGPVIATPPVQRLEPGAKSMVRLSTTPDISKLPQDRESLFYFNLREIPPRNDISLRVVSTYAEQQKNTNAVPPSAIAITSPIPADR